MTDNQVGPFHVAANPRDTPRSLATRYRAVFGAEARRRASEDEEKAEALGLTIRQRLCAQAEAMLRREDRAAGISDDDW